MGCYKSKLKRKFTSIQENYSEKLKEAIDFNNKKRFDIIIELAIQINKNKDLILDDKLISFKNYTLSPLCYCLVQGKSEFFSYLLKCGASLSKMNEMFESYNLRALDIICAKGYAELLKILLPKYLESKNPSENSENTTYFPTFDPELAFPVHLATKSGMLNILNIIHEFFTEKTEIPLEFDLNALDPNNGENCGLLACRYGNFPLLKFFHETCHVNLKIFNKYDENAVFLCLRGYKKNKIYNYFICVVYLVDVVHIDITYKYQDMLSLVVCPDTLDFLEKKLAEQGIIAKQKEMNNSVSQDYYKEMNYSPDFARITGLETENSFESSGSYQL